MLINFTAALESVPHAINCVEVCNNGYTYANAIIGEQAIGNRHNNHALLALFLHRGAPTHYEETKALLKFKTVITGKGQLVIPLKQTKLGPLGGKCITCGNENSLLAHQRSKGHTKGSVDCNKGPLTGDDAVCMLCQFKDGTPRIPRGEIDNAPIQAALGGSEPRKPLQQQGDSNLHFIKIFPYNGIAFLAEVVDGKALFADLATEDISDENKQKLEEFEAFIDSEGSILAPIHPKNYAYFGGKCSLCGKFALLVDCSKKHGYWFPDGIDFTKPNKATKCIECQHQEHQSPKKRAASQSPVQDDDSVTSCEQKSGEAGHTQVILDIKHYIKCEKFAEKMGKDWMTDVIDGLKEHKNCMRLVKYLNKNLIRMGLKKKNVKETTRWILPEYHKKKKGDRDIESID